MARLTPFVKQGLTMLGARLPARTIYACHAAVNYLRLGHWMREQAFDFPYLLPDRWAVFKFVAALVRDKRVLYLEFGVHHGESILLWAGQLRHPESHLHGFDSFEGLPEPWGPYDRGFFSLQGRIPTTTDARVQFFKGWFEDTLPKYELPPYDVLVILLDADLYSSTAYVLQHLRPHFAPGTLLGCDDMNHVDHVPQALREFVASSGVKLRPVCADRSLALAFFECV